MQRLRIKFSRGEELKFISHLDITRLWQRAFIRAGIALAYSEGFNPHPKISLASPLALGVTSDVELMDIVLARAISPPSFITAVNRQLPPGIRVTQVYPIAMILPALQAQVRQAEYRVEVETTKPQSEVESAVSNLLALEHLPWEHQRDTGPKRYDLRVLIDDLWLIECKAGACTLGMRLRCDSGGAGRPEQVTAALGFEPYPRSVHRTRLILETS